MRTWVTAPTSLPFCIIGEPLTSVVNKGQHFYSICGFTCRAGVYLPPYCLMIIVCNGGSKPPPYDLFGYDAFAIGICTAPVSF